MITSKPNNITGYRADRRRDQNSVFHVAHKVGADIPERDGRAYNLVIMYMII